MSAAPAARAAADIVRGAQTRSRRGEPVAAARDGRMRLLLVEPDAALSSEYKRMLDEAGFDVELGHGSLQNGALAHFPVVMIGARTAAEERASLLDRLQNGANPAPSLVLSAADGEDAPPLREHLVQEFQIAALVRRLQSLLTPRRPPRGFARRFGNVSIDGDGQVVIAGKDTYFQPTEVLVLSLLMRRKGKLVPKRSIEVSLYGKSDETTANAVEVRVHRLRKSLAATAANLSIRTIRNAGYFLARDDAAT